MFLLRMTVTEALEIEQSRLRERAFGVWCWEATDGAVVLGLGGKLDDEVCIHEAEDDGMKVIKRRSGGGTVVLGPGVVCFSVVLPGRKELCNPSALAGEILPYAAEALSALGIKAEIKGFGDLAIRGKKICGTAQKWTRDAILFHGSLLVDFDLDKLERYLPHPPREPEYRSGRAHGDFCTTLSTVAGRRLYAEEVASALIPSLARYCKITMTDAD